MPPLAEMYRLAISGSFFTLLDFFSSWPGFGRQSWVPILRPLLKLGTYCQTLAELQRQSLDPACVPVGIKKESVNSWAHLCDSVNSAGLSTGRGCALSGGGGREGSAFYLPFICLRLGKCEGWGSVAWSDLVGCRWIPKVLGLVFTHFCWSFCGLTKSGIFLATSVESVLVSTLSFGWGEHVLNSQAFCTY